MIERILLAVDDSPDSLAATRLAVQLAAGLGSQLRAVHVLVDHEVDIALMTATGRPEGPGRGAAVASMLTRVVSLAKAEGVAVEAETVSGGVPTAILDMARDWAADLVVIGKSSRSAMGEPYVGALTRHVLEFADQPVLVVPAMHHARARR